MSKSYMYCQCYYLKRRSSKLSEYGKWMRVISVMRRMQSMFQTKVNFYWQQWFRKELLSRGPNGGLGWYGNLTNKRMVLGAHLMKIIQYLHLRSAILWNFCSDFETEVTLDWNRQIIWHIIFNFYFIWLLKITWVL